MGVDPAKISFKKAKDQTSRTEGNTIYVGSGLISGSESRLEFVIGHELSHYKTGDVWPVSGINPYMMTAGALGLLLGGPYSALAGGLLGFGGELAAGGGLVNALITGLSTTGMIGLGPLGGWLGGTVGGLLGAAAGSLVSLPAIFKLLEIKSDLQSAMTFGPEGGIGHFRSAMTENKYEQPSMPTLKEGNAIFDPTHPPLSMRVGYLELLQKLVGSKTD
jgi:Zn-dependent protease with chaperone function